MKLLRGKKCSKEVALVLQQKIAGFSTAPKMVIIQIGNNPASNVYIANKIVYANSIGALVDLRKYSEDISESAIIQEIERINLDNSIHGVLVQMPIPAHLNFSNIVNAIYSEKDIDGLGAINVYKLIMRDSTGLVPATARGVFTLLQKNDIEVAGKRVVVIGRSLLVGKSTALHLLNHDATVTVCHSKTKDLAEFTKKADIIVVATGHPGVITDTHITPGQIVVDVGISVVDGEITGDTKIERHEILHAFSPVPGGVGPMTVASLFENLVQAYETQKAKNKL